MQPGKYNIKIGNIIKTAYVSAEGGVLSFEGSGGEVLAVRISEEFAAAVDEPYETEENMAYVKIGNAFKKQIRLAEGKYAAADALSEIFGYSAETQGDICRFYSGGEQIAVIKNGEKDVLTKGGTHSLSEAAEKTENGFMLTAEDLCSLLSAGGKYVPYAETFYIKNAIGNGYETDATAYALNGDIKVNARLNGKFSADVICAAFSENKNLLYAGKMKDMGSGRYTLDIEGGAGYENPLLKLFIWDENCSTLAETKEFYCFNPQKYISKVSLAAGTMERSQSNDNYIRLNYNSENSTLIAEKACEYKEASIAMKTVGRKLNEGGYVLYSTGVKVNKKSSPGEYLQLRIRGSELRALNADGTEKMLSVYVPYNLPYETGDEYRLSYIADLMNKKGYIYINGELKKECSFESWKDIDGEWGSILAANFYFMGSEGSSGGEFELYDSYAVSFRAEVSLDEVKESMNCLYIK